MFLFIQNSTPRLFVRHRTQQMVGACKMHKDFVLGVDAAERLLAVEPENAGHYVLVSNIYALARRMDRVD